MLIPLLFDASPNEIRFVHGTKRRIVDSLMFADLLGSRSKHPLRSRRVLPALGRSLTSSTRRSSLSILGKYKYVCFNGRIFIDGFAPRWPGRIFDRVMARQLHNLSSRPEEWIPSTVALIISITRKCAYRCERCYAIHTLGGEEVLTGEKLLEIAKGFLKVGVGVIGHVLQPNQYVEGSKPLTAEERERFWDPTHKWARSVVVGYPYLRRKGEELRAEGVAFHDLTGIFSTEERTIYRDRCCHYNLTGNEILARAIADLIARNDRGADTPAGGDARLAPRPSRR